MRAEFILMLTALTSLAMGVAGQDPPKSEPEYKMGQLFFVMLKTGKAQLNISEAESAKMQAAHIEHLRSLVNADKMVILGPVVNGGDLRGICVMNLKTKEEVEAVFAEDAWVKSGALELDIHAWFCATNIWNKPKEIMDITMITIAFLKRGPAWTPEVTDETKAIQAGHMANIQHMAKVGALVAAGPMYADTDFRGIFVFKGDEMEKYKALAAEDPAVKSGRLVIEWYQWYVPKDAIPGPPKAVKE